MCKMFASVALSGILAVVVPFTAQALPVSASQPWHGESTVTPVAQGCGPGMHRGPMGRCRPGGVVVVAPRPAVVVAPRAAVVGPRACPRGRGPGGACR
jgi:hypothetical protein